MKAGHSLGQCLLWALLYCLLNLSHANEDELMDFDFTDNKANDNANIDWHLEAAAAAEQTQAEKKLETNMLDFSVDMEEQQAEPHVPPFDWREKVLRNALSKALTDRALRQKFAEVMPILRVLSSQQRLALSALISAQMNAKQGHELKLEQVRMMFGNDKKLLLPIVFDLANLVKNSARKYINLSKDTTKSALHQPPIQQRKFELLEDQLDDSVGTIAVGSTAESQAAADTSSLEDFFVEMQTDLLDPQMINEALQSDISSNQTKQQSNSSSSSGNQAKRPRRAVHEFVHKLPRSVPITFNEQELLRGMAARTIKLNTTAFQQPSGAMSTQPVGSSAASATTAIPAAISGTQSYMEIEDLAFAGLNGSELELTANARADAASQEPLPSPEELIAGPRYRLNKLHNLRLGTSSTQPLPIKRKRVQTYQQSRGRPKHAASSHNTVVAAPKKCERFTSSMCIRTNDYPLDQIMGSIRRHKNAMSALLAEFYDKPNNNLEFGDDFDDYTVNKKRREDEGSAGGMCQSVVRYARPQKARSASGEWKYIVNTGQHTQTLRLEKCSNPGESCSYLAHTYRSHCSQVYNYHRLLSWDKLRGLHVDIFKVPTCCSCQVDGYRQHFPPLSSIQAKDFTPNFNLDVNGYSTINEEDLDYNDESDEDDLGFAPYSGVGNELFLSSKKVRSKLPAPSTVGSYLSPPDDEEHFGSSAGYKSHKSRAGSTSSKKYYNQLSHRRPQFTDARVDLDLSPSETHADQEVNVFGASLAGEKSRVPLKRKRIYSATHTAAIAATAATDGGARVGAGAAAATSATAATAASAPHSQPAVVHAASQPTAAPSDIAIGASNGYIQRNYIGTSGSKSRPRHYAATPPTPVSKFTSSSSTPTAPLSTESNAYQRPTLIQQQQQQQSTPISQSPPLYHVNSIYGSSGNAHNVSKRINYNYHPIIDFFKKNKRVNLHDKPVQRPDADDYDFIDGEQQHVFPQRAISSSIATLGAGAGVGVAAGTGTYQYTISNTNLNSNQNSNSNERRIGFGGAGAGAGPGSGSGHVGYANDNAWQPMVVEQ